MIPTLFQKPAQPRFEQLGELQRAAFGGDFRRSLEDR